MRARESERGYDMVFGFGPVLPARCPLSGYIGICNDISMNPLSPTSQSPTFFPGSASADQDLTSFLCHPFLS